MERKPLKRFGGLIATALVGLVLVGCRGADGRNGTDGANGNNGSNGVNLGTVIDANALTGDQWAGLKIQGKITKVTINGAPEVEFQLTDAAGNGIKGFGAWKTLNSLADRSGNFATLENYPNFAFSIAKLVPETAAKDPSRWVSYLVRTVPTKKADGSINNPAPTRPSTDVNGTLTDNGNGTYKYRFYHDITGMQAFLDGYTYTGNNKKADLGNVTYEPNQVHRVVIQFSGNLRGTGSNTADGKTTATAVALENPINVVYDWIPSQNRVVGSSDPGREITSTAACNQCHTQIGTTTPHGGRIDTRYCSMCHTDQRKYGYAEATMSSPTSYTGDTRKIDGMAVGEMTAMVHRVHMGGSVNQANYATQVGLTKTGYNYANVYYDKLDYPQDRRHCAKCHTDVGNTATPQGANWYNKPSRLACGSCHDAVNFATGAGHGTSGIVQTADTQCIECHKPADIKTYHMTDNKTEHNPVLPEGLKDITYEIVSASVTGTTATVIFNIKSDGTKVTFVNPAATVSNPLTGFTGSPSFLMAYALPEFGIDKPADWNNLGRANGQPATVSIANLLSTSLAATRGTIVPDTNGNYKATILNAFPTGATMRTVALQGYFTQVTPNVARHAVSVYKTVTGDTARRVVVDPRKCADCHEWFEGHGGNRVYETQVCATCHVPGLTTSGRGLTNAFLSTFAFTTAQRAILTEWTGVDWTQPLPAEVALKFPQVTNNLKDMLHGLHMGEHNAESFKVVRDSSSRGTINIINGGKIVFPGKLTNCQACHTYNGFSTIPAGALPSRQTADTGGMTTAAQAKAALGTSNPADLMTTPFTAACVSCHSSATAKTHMTLNGGQVLVPRASLNLAGETCAICHGAGATYDPAKVHK